MKSKNIIPLLAICITSLLAACSTATKQTGPNIYASIPPIAYLVDRITGTDNCGIIVPPGASPETYEPTPRQIAEISRSKIIFTTGLIDFETVLIDKIWKNSETEVIDLSRGLDLLEEVCGHSHHQGHTHAHAHDPHIWGSPKMLKSMATTITNTLLAIYPDSTRYIENLKEILSELSILDGTVKDKVADSGADSFIIYHPALTYWANDYGLEQISIEYEGKEPSADRLLNIIKSAREKNITTILFQKQFSSHAVETLARDLNAQVIEFDPLEYDVIRNIYYLTDVITKR